jgi:hypothetical protein
MIASIRYLLFTCSIAALHLGAKGQECPRIELSFEAGSAVEPTPASWSQLERSNRSLYQAGRIDCTISIPWGFPPNPNRTDVHSKRWDWVARWMEEEQVQPHALTMRWVEVKPGTDRPDVVIEHDGCGDFSFRRTLLRDTTFLHASGLELRCPLDAAEAMASCRVERMPTTTTQVDRGWPGNEVPDGVPLDVLALLHVRTNDSLQSLRQSWALQLLEATPGDRLFIARPGQEGMILSGERIRLQMRGGIPWATWHGMMNGTWAIVRRPAEAPSHHFEWIAPDGWAWTEVVCRTDGSYERAPLPPSAHAAFVADEWLDVQHWIQVRATNQKLEPRESPWIRGDSLPLKRTLWLRPGDQRTSPVELLNLHSL